MEPETNKRGMDQPERLSSAPAPPTRGRFVVSVFGDITPSGPWPAGRRLSPVAVFGDIDVDLRDIPASSGELVIRAIAPFGNIDVLVPAGAEVDVGGFTLFGSKKVSVREIG